MLKKILPFVMFLACLVPAMTTAQKKPVARKKPAPTPAPTPAGMSLTDAATKVADQLKLVSRFIYVYGKITNGLEFAEAKTKSGESSPEITAKNQQMKQSVVSNIAALKEGIDKVGLELKSNDRLQVQYLKLTGASDAVARAQQLALAGSFDEAGKSLVIAVEKMAETLIALR